MPNSSYTSGPVDAIQLCRQMLDGSTSSIGVGPMTQKETSVDGPAQSGHSHGDLRPGEHPASFVSRGEIVIGVQYMPSEKDCHGHGGRVKQEVEEHIRAVCQADPYLRGRPARIEWILDADRAEVSVDHPFVGILQDSVAAAGLQRALSGFGAHSDIGLPTELGRTPTVNFGPGDPAMAHQPNERVAIADLVNCTKADRFDDRTLAPLTPGIGNPPQRCGSEPGGCGSRGVAESRRGRNPARRVAEARRR